MSVFSSLFPFSGVSFESGERAVTKHRKIQVFEALARPQNSQKWPKFPEVAISFESGEVAFLKHRKLQAFGALLGAKISTTSFLRRECS